MKLNDLFESKATATTVAPQFFTSKAVLLEIKQHSTKSGLSLQLKFRDTEYGVIGNIFLKPHSQSDRARKYAYATILRMLERAGVSKESDLQTLVGHEYTVSFSKQENGYYEVTAVEPREIPAPPPVVEEEYPF